MNGLTTIESKRRAVAPIIATLLMVAIAVVGGILIFVFTQGFFADEQVVGPTVDNIRIFGYDARDAGAFCTQTTPAVCTNAPNLVPIVLGNGDSLSIFITNLGDKPTGFQSVRVFGVTHSIATGDCTQPGAHLFDGAAAPASVLEPNEDGTICVEIAGLAAPVKAGRTIPVQLETTNGQVSQVNMINGATRGL